MPQTKQATKKSSRIFVTESRRKYLESLSKKAGVRYNSDTVEKIVKFVKSREAEFVEWAKSH
jgi:hypothetical protein